jgi:catechol 2,3-dioxygenase-like lactoylglutathione lyase family enzyme
MTLGRTTPILRIFDEAKAREFYVDFLGFKVDWEHRFEPDLPLYMQVSRDGCVLHLSEHHGDACPGAAIRVETRGLSALHQELLGKRVTSMLALGSSSSPGAMICPSRTPSAID